MNLPAQVVEIVNEMYNKFKPLAHGTDSDRRLLTLQIAEQLCFSIDPNWGTKAQSPSHPQSKDAIAYLNPDDSMDIWDWQNGATRLPVLVPGEGPHYPNITTQFFIKVNPVDHLGGVIIDPPPPNNDIARLITIVEAQSRLIALQNEAIDDLTRKVNEFEIPEFPVYEGTFLGIRITLSPKK